MKKSRAHDVLQILSSVTEKWEFDIHQYTEKFHNTLMMRLKHNRQYLNYSTVLVEMIQYGKQNWSQHEIAANYTPSSKILSLLAEIMVARRDTISSSWIFIETQNLKGSTKSRISYSTSNVYSFYSRIYREHSQVLRWLIYNRVRCKLLYA